MTAGNFYNQAKIKHCHEYVLAYAPQPALFAYLRVIDPSVGAASKLTRPFIQNTIVKHGLKSPLSVVLLPAGFPARVASAAGRRNPFCGSSLPPTSARCRTARGS